MALNVIGVIHYCLDQAQMDKFLPEHIRFAKVIYNMELDKLAGDFEYQWFFKRGPVTSFVSGQKQYTLPTDYLKSDSCYLVDSSTGSRGANVTIISPWQFDRNDTGSITGPASCAYINSKDRKIVFNSALNEVGNSAFQLSYYRTPDLIDVDSTINDEDSVDFSDQTAIIESIISKLMKYIDDDRYGMQKMEAKEELRDTRMNSFDYDDHSQMSLGRPFRSGKRPTRGGGGFGGFGF